MNVKHLEIGALLLTCTTFGMAGSVKASFRGEISDTHCAMNVHSLSRSHEEMIEKKTMGTDAASCARACGGEWVLRSGDDVYRLKNPEGTEDYAGQKVQITGTLDTKTNTIDNVNIELAPNSKHAAH